MRTLYTVSISQSAEFVWLDAADRLGNDLSADTVQIGLAGWGAVPAVFATLTSPDVVQFPAVGQIRVGYLVGAGGHALTAGRYYAWLLITDHPEVPPVMCGAFQII